MTWLPLALIRFRLAASVLFFPFVLCRLHAGLSITLLSAGLLSDIADGMIARRLGITTLPLRRLDTQVDLVFYGCATVAALMNASFPVARLWPWLIAYGSLFVVRNAVDYLRYRASPSYHMWSGKLWSVVLFVHIVVLFYGTQGLFLLPLAFGFYAVNAVEGITASLLLPQPSKDIPSVWHVFVRRRSLG